MPKRVLVLCTGNSCRSQMAERLFPLLSDGLWEGVSAGSNPSGYVHPKAIEVMAELGGICLTVRVNTLINIQTKRSISS